MPTIFTRIINREIPGRFVWEDDTCIAMIDIRPLHRGHTLVIPRVEVDHWIDLDQETMAHVTDVARTIGTAQQAAFSPARIGLLVAGFEVPHTHLHVVPIDTMADLDFSQGDPEPTDLDEVAELLRTALRDLGYTDQVPAD